MKQGPLGRAKFKEYRRSNASVCPDAGKNSEVAPGIEVMFEGKPDLKISKQKRSRS